MDKIYQIIDANFNRVREGLRVIEDGVRFYMKNESYFRKIKNLRHTFTQKIYDCFPAIKLKKERHIMEDVGKEYDLREKQKIQNIIERNCLRIGESLRVIEEYSKCVNPEISDVFHDLRFKFYAIEKQILTTISRKKIHIPFVYVILNLKDQQEILNFAEEVIEGKPDIVQLRYKGENIKFFTETGKKLRKLIPEDIIYIINDRIDVCEIVQADGVHLGQNDIDVDDARKILPEKIIGVSTNSFEQAKKFIKKDIDYIAIGAIYPSPTKRQRKVIGPEIIKKIKSLLSIPVVAIGGINKENVNEVIRNGADGVAFISAVEKAENKKNFLIQIKRQVKREWKKTTIPLKKENQNR